MKQRINDFKKLNIWSDSMDLAEKVYQLSKGFPKEELYGITAQIRRSAISVPSNIAEGAGRNNPREFRQFLGIASGSCAELETQLLLAGRFGFLSEEILNETVATTRSLTKMIYNLKETLKSRANESSNVKESTP